MATIRLLGVLLILTLTAGEDNNNEPDAMAVTGGGRCKDGVKYYDDGERWQCCDGCNICRCVYGMTLRTTNDCGEAHNDCGDGSNGGQSQYTKDDTSSSVSEASTNAECLEGGVSHKNGDHWTCCDGCNKCSCVNGRLISTEMGCPPEKNTCPGEKEKYKSLSSTENFNKENKDKENDGKRQENSYPPNEGLRKEEENKNDSPYESKSKYDSGGKPSSYGSGGNKKLDALDVSVDRLANITRMLEDVSVENLFNLHESNMYHSNQLQDQINKMTNWAEEEITGGLKAEDPGNVNGQNGPGHQPDPQGYPGPDNPDVHQDLPPSGDEINPYESTNKQQSYPGPYEAEKSNESSTMLNVSREKLPDPYAALGNPEGKEPEYKPVNSHEQSDGYRPLPHPYDYSEEKDEPDAYRAEGPGYAPNAGSPSPYDAIRLPENPHDNNPNFPPQNGSSSLEPSGSSSSSTVSTTTVAVTGGDPSGSNSSSAASTATVTNGSSSLDPSSPSSTSTTAGDSSPSGQPGSSSSPLSNITTTTVASDSPPSGQPGSSLSSSSTTNTTTAGDSSSSDPPGTSPSSSSNSTASVASDPTPPETSVTTSSSSSSISTITTSRDSADSSPPSPSTTSATDESTSASDTSTPPAANNTTAATTPPTTNNDKSEPTSLPSTTASQRAQDTTGDQTTPSEGSTGTTNSALKSTTPSSDSLLDTIGHDYAAETTPNADLLNVLLSTFSPFFTEK